MKKNLITALFLLFTIICFAQKGPLTGSGKIVNKNFDFTDFKEIKLLDLNGKVVIQVGQPDNISIAIDDNLEALLDVNKNDEKLTISFKGNRNNKMYIENTNIVIKISLPLLTEINQDGNNSLLVQGITGEQFSLICKGNGNATLNGKANKVDLKCTGNGTIYAQNLLANNVNIIKRGNGSVYTNTDNNFSVQANGNGNIINNGQGRAAADAIIIGNGDVKYPNQQKLKSNEEKRMEENNKKKITVTILNNNNKRINLKVRYPIKGSYGISINANDSLKESFPIGTKIYRANQIGVLKKPLFIITEESAIANLVIGKESEEY